ncbi:MAG TPA: dTMP kinase [Candidatus Polarisedimenticolia bacterium]|nr:dTMP kinase [Candidatus Polarisedimenticolia bacterium]
MARGLFITFEGVEGSGKTTQVELLGQALGTWQPVIVREPGGTELGERMRDVLLFGGMAIDREAEMYLFMAARAQVVHEVIEPALGAGRVVIADRYHDSTVAYQGGGRGLSVYWPPSFPKPDITFLVSVPVEVGHTRMLLAGKHPDRVERESLEFHQRVADEYARLAKAEPQRYTVVDGTDSQAHVHAAVMERVDRALAGSATS